MCGICSFLQAEGAAFKMALVEDDIDDLLDEVENSFIAKPPEKQKVASSSHKTTKNNMISRPNEKKAKWYGPSLATVI